MNYHTAYFIYMHTSIYAILNGIRDSGWATKGEVEVYENVVNYYHFVRNK